MSGVDAQLESRPFNLVSCASLGEGLRILALAGMTGADWPRKGATPSDPNVRASGAVEGKAPRLVLIVDDDPDVLESYARLIQHAVRGVIVRTAPNAQRALELLASETFALIVSDYRMPGMNGIDFLSEAHRLQPDAVRILVSAYPDQELEVRAYKEVGPNFLSKSADPSVLIRRINVGLAPSG